MNSVSFPLTTNVIAGVLTLVIGSLLFYLFRFRRKKTRWVVFALAILTTVLLDVFFLGAGAGSYHLNVTVTTDGRRPLGNVRVSSTPGGEIKKGAGNWEIVIPSDALPANRQVVVVAEADTFRSGSATLQLSDDHHPHVAVRLEAREATLRGVVLDEVAKPIAGARVQLFGFGDESVLTDANGGFQLPAHVAEGQEIRVKAERAGFEPADQYQVLGDAVMTIRLFRSSQ